MIILNKEETLQRKDEIISAIKAGMIFIYPTDTIYGIGCDATNEDAVQKIREIKQRDQKPVLVIAPSKNWINANLFVPEMDKLDLLPGPYSLILKVKQKGFVAPSVSFDETLGVRIPNNWFTEIVSEAGIPFVTTSVNITGQKNMESLEDLSEDFLNQVDYVIYEGPNHGKQSTRIDLTHI
jgi:L-threonylcarbamoyladenylate synthase